MKGMYGLLGSIRSNLQPSKITLSSLTNEIVQDACVDGIISIAVLHHISSRERRISLLAEMARLMKPGARGLVTVWASEQEDTKKLAKWESLSHNDPKSGTGPFKLAVEMQEHAKLKYLSQYLHMGLA